MNSTPLSARLRYSFDNAMARGLSAQIALLTVATFLVIVLATIAVVLTHTTHPGTSFLGMIWISLLHVLDNGNISNESGSGWYVFVMLVVTIAGLTVLAALFGIVTNGINDRMEALRRGRSRVVEQRHTLILGWSPQIFSILNELVVANENQRRACVVILADRDKLEMEEEIRSRVPRRNRTRIVCRSGSPLDLSDLEIVSPQTARAIIVLAPEEDDPDTAVIKSLLAITHHPHRREAPYHIVAPIKNPRNLEVAELAGRGEAQIVLGHDLISRITVQTCRQSGLSVVYTELLDFEGDEFYFQQEPKLIDFSFGEALLAYETSAVIGLYQEGRARINPPMDTAIAAGDQIIAISEDDDTIVLSGRTVSPAEDAILSGRAQAGRPERTLIFNWNSRTPGILCEMDNYVAPDSMATVVVNEAGEYSIPPLSRLHVTIVRGDPTDRATLDNLDIGSYDHVIVLSEADALGVQEADARTLTTLLHLRRIKDANPRRFSVVSEMADLRNRDLATATRADDFIVSDQLVSLMLSQLSENPALQPVFDDLFDAEGSEIYLKPIEDYVVVGRPLDFYTLVEAGRRRGEVAIGYRIDAQSENAAVQYGVVVNPIKSQTVTYAPGDKIIVIAED